MGFKPCLGIMRLGKKYGPDRLEAACQRVVLLKDPKCRQIESILKSGLDQKPLPETQPELPAMDHEFIRGAAYYGVDSSFKTQEDRHRSVEQN